MSTTINHIPTRYFSHSISFYDRVLLKVAYGDDKWDSAKNHLSETKRISKSAIIVAENMKLHLDLDLFPLIVKIATKGFDISGGTYAFMMYDNEGEENYFDCRASWYKAKSGSYKFYNYGNDVVITRIT